MGIIDDKFIAQELMWFTKKNNVKFLADIGYNRLKGVFKQDYNAKSIVVNVQCI